MEFEASKFIDKPIGEVKSSPANLCEANRRRIDPECKPFQYVASEHTATCVRIDDGDGVFSGDSHVRVSNVQIGQMVNNGDVITLLVVRAWQPAAHP